MQDPRHLLKKHCNKKGEKSAIELQKRHLANSMVRWRFWSDFLFMADENGLLSSP